MQVKLLQKRPKPDRRKSSGDDPGVDGADEKEEAKKPEVEQDKPEGKKGRSTSDPNLAAGGKT